MKKTAIPYDSKIPTMRVHYLNILLIIVMFLVVGAFAYMVLNPNKSQSEARNNIRTTDVSTIMKIMKTYVDTTGNIPSVIPFNRECASIGNEICKSNASNCNNYVKLDNFLKEVGMETIPVDPNRINGNGTGYYISNDGEGNLIVCAPLSERNVSISLKQFMY